MGGIEGMRRRGFLGAGAGAAAIAALAGAGGWLAYDGRDEVYQALVGDVRPSVLSIAEFAILDALATTLITQGKTAPSARQARVAERLDKELSFHPGGQLVSDVKTALLFIERAPILDGLGPRFTGLSQADKARFLQNSLTSPLTLRRTVLSGVKFLIFFIYYCDDRTWPSIGYGGPQMPEKPFEGGNSIKNLPPLRKTGGAA